MLYKFFHKYGSTAILMHNAIQACRREKKHVGICGQAPSDDLDFAKWLLKEKIDSISLTPDSIIDT